MADANLSQSEADALIAMEKVRMGDSENSYPDPGGKLSIPLASPDGREVFLLDVSRGQINLAKVTHQNRARQIVVLMRLDVGGAPHRNPDGEEIPCPHLHIYQQGLGDKWAFPAPRDRYSNLDDLMQTLEDFMRHCNVTKPPKIHPGLF
jgi:uncharacterized protein DUF6978